MYVYLHVRTINSYVHSKCAEQNYAVTIHFIQDTTLLRKSKNENFVLTSKAKESEDYSTDISKRMTY